MTLTLDVKVNITKPTRGLSNKKKKIIGLSLTVFEILALKVLLGSVKTYGLATTAILLLTHSVLVGHS